VRDAAGIFHTDVDELDDDGEPRRRELRLHDLRGTFITKLILELDLTDRQIAGVMGWSVESVQNIRTIYVSDTSYAAALGSRVRHLQARDEACPTASCCACNKRGWGRSSAG
jgi:hypothetical protein